MTVSGELCALATVPCGKNPVMNWIRGWLGTRAGLDIVEKGKKSLTSDGN
jgi:hypothetical protein